MLMLSHIYVSVSHASRFRHNIYIFTQTYIPLSHIVLAKSCILVIQNQRCDCWRKVSKASFTYNLNTYFRLVVLIVKDYSNKYINERTKKISHISLAYYSSFLFILNSNLYIPCILYIILCTYMYSIYHVSVSVDVAHSWHCVCAYTALRSWIESCVIGNKVLH